MRDVERTGRFRLGARARLAGHSSWRKPAKPSYGPGGRLRLSWYSAATAAGIQPLSQR